MQTLRIYWNFYPYWLDRIGKWKIISIFQSFCLYAFKYFRYFTNSTSRVSKFTVLYWALNWKIIPRIRLLIEPDINAISCIARLHFLQLQPVIETISHKNAFVWIENGSRVTLQNCSTLLYRVSELWSDYLLIINPV